MTRASQDTIGQIPPPGDMPEPLALIRLLDYDGVAPYLGCTPRMVRKLCETRQLDVVKVGRLVRIEPAAVARYIASRRRAAS